ncbi:MAG: hypothetical protein Harvfovirus5_37 [Harvfovirus sp.]|uniref:Sel1 repeat family protein n=1 Tax=Harvfovirus sp. TaxID=2487768 RepID=A0A3G5A4I4_9VIRU|nr:MAG: hypothetical protein Harvfovirus5_37 [Harvfovirus sp.]
MGSKQSKTIDKKSSFHEMLERTLLDDKQAIGQLFGFLRKKSNQDLYPFTFNFYLEKAIATKNSFAQNTVGYMYYRGKGVQKDLKNSLKWLQLSVSQGNSYGQCNMGTIYEEGEAVEKNLIAAHKWYKISAENNNAWGQCWLAYSYCDGFVEKNLPEAINLFKKAASQNNNNGYYGYACLCLFSGVTEDTPGMAMKYLNIAAESGFCSALETLAVMYELGNRVPKDSMKAYKFYKLLAKDYDDKYISKVEELMRKSSIAAVVLKENFELNKINEKQKDDIEKLTQQVDHLMYRPQGPKFKELEQDYYKLADKSVLISKN